MKIEFLNAAQDMDHRQEAGWEEVPNGSFDLGHPLLAYPILVPLSPTELAIYGGLTYGYYDKGSTYFPGNMYSSLWIYNTESNILTRE